MKIIQKPTVHFDERKTPIDMVVIHATESPTLAYTFELLLGSKAPNRISAHYVIDRDGTVYQLVDESKRAWHAGVSIWDGQTDLNSHSIGIEFQSPKDGDFTAEQLDAGVELVADIVARHSIPLRNIVRHKDIAPTRKSDPNELFPWDEFILKVARKKS